MILTDTTSTIDRPVDRSAVRTTSGATAGCIVMARTAGDKSGVTAAAAYQDSVAHRTTTELPVSFFGGQVWFRPAALDATVLATPGHLAWSPPT